MAEDSESEVQESAHAPLARSMSDPGLMILSTEWSTNRSIPTMLLPLVGDLMNKRELMEMFQRLTERFPRFRSVVDSASGQYVEVRAFDLNDHLHVIDIGERGGVKDVVDSFQNHPFHPERPLWDAWLITCLSSTSGTKQFIYFRAHHCLGDGYAIGHALEQMSDCPPKRKLPHFTALQRTLNMISLLLWILVGGVGVFLRWIYMTLTYPAVPSLFQNVRVQENKKVAYKRICSLEELNRIRSDMKKGATVNDIMLSLVSYAIDKYSQRHGHEMAPRSAIGLAMPVNIRATPITEDLGNRFGSYSVFLPLGEASMRERVAAVHAVTRTVKALPEQYITFALTAICARLPSFLSQAIVDALCEKVKIAVTNVRASPEQLVFLGRKVPALYGFLPAPNGVALGVGICSYAGEMYVTVNADESLIDNPIAFVDLMSAGMEEFRGSIGA